MRKFLVIAGTLAAVALAPQAAHAHNDRVGVFVAGAVTGAIVTHVLTDRGHHHVYHHRSPRVVEHHYHHYPPRHRVREVHHHHPKHWGSAKHHGPRGHARHASHRHYR
ncbi:MAG TPA: hypothetical protein VKZ48_02915 [Burkholderiales bacterium]|nr:hypothetical protein [Burkholderiales bacterium]